MPGKGWLPVGTNRTPASLRTRSFLDMIIWNLAIWQVDRTKGGRIDECLEQKRC